MKKLFPLVLSLAIILMALPVQGALLAQPNLLTNGDFGNLNQFSTTNQYGMWKATMAGGSTSKSQTNIAIMDGTTQGFDGNAVQFDITKAGDRWWSYALSQAVSMSPNKTFTISFKAKASADRYFDLSIQRVSCSNSMHKFSVPMTNEVKTYTYTFNTILATSETSGDAAFTEAENVIIGFDGGIVSLPADPTASQPSFWISDVKLAEAPQILSNQNMVRNSEVNNASFSGDWAANPPSSSGARVNNTSTYQHKLNGSYALEVTTGGTLGKWNNTLKQTGLPAIAPGKYRLSFWAYLKSGTAKPLQITLSAASADPIRTNLFDKADIQVTNQPQYYSYDITVSENRTAGGTLWFLLYQMDLGSKFMLDSVMLTPIPNEFDMKSYLPADSQIPYGTKNFSYIFDSPILSNSLTEGAVKLNNVGLLPAQMAIDSIDNSKLNITLDSSQHLTASTVFTFPTLSSVYGYGYDGNVTYSVDEPDPFTVNDAVYKNSEGKEIGAVESGEITIDVDITTTKDYTFKAIAGVYEVNDSGNYILKSIDVNPTQLNGSDIITLNVVVPAENTSKCKIGIFMWSNFEAMAPIVNAIWF